jgi:RecB family endonuclease NucS
MTGARVRRRRAGVAEPLGPRRYPCAVRLVIARCSVDYCGRLEAHLPEAVRLIMVKADGSVMVHADGGAYKPLNWMNPPNRLVVGPDGVWVVTSPKGEQLRITITEVLADHSHDLGVDPGLQKDGVEAHLQELLAADPCSLGEELRLVRREYPTDIGPVDLLCRDADGRAVAIDLAHRGDVDGQGPSAPRPRDGQAVAVEVKRRGTIDAVEQLSRYLERLNLDSSLRPVRGILAAQVITPQAKVLAESRGIRCVVVDYDAMRGIERAQQALF